MEHTYLILAHNEFDVLNSLISNLDDIRNTIIIHFDKKVKILPEIKTRFSRLIILQERYNLSWGDASIIKAEFSLMNYALYNTNSQYYHIISGVHLPLKNQDKIHDYFEKLNGKSLFKPMGSNNYELSYKLQYYHLLLPLAAQENKIVSYIFSRMNDLFVRIQKLFRFKRHKDVVFSKASQWCSLNRESLKYLVENKNSIIKKYKFTFCGDEIFIISELMNNSFFKEQIIFDHNIVYTKFENSRPRVITEIDYESLINSSFLFARKFSISSFEIVKMISRNIKHAHE